MIIFSFNFANSFNSFFTHFFFLEHKKLNKVLAQINQIADLDTEFLQKWLSKLVLPNENESDSLIQSLKSNVSILKSKYVFKQLAMHLVNEKVNNDK